VEGGFDIRTLGTAVLGLILLALVPVGCVVYWRIIRKTFGGEGKVRVERIGYPELVLGFLLITMFLGLIALSLNIGKQEVQNDDIIQGSIFYLFLVGVIAAFLQVRGRNIGELFGFGSIPLPQSLWRGFLLVLTAYPLVTLVAAVVQKIFGTETEQQDVVTFFQNAAKNSDTLGMASTVFMASILAPFAEEFIFRGFLYGVTKRFFGILPGILFTSAMFAAIHMNLAALPALFVLAICLNLAYESTGSLAVPMVMHAVFNLTQLLFLFVLARWAPAL
jgi:membrane protease YdiL (CAAX protease family)